MILFRRILFYIFVLIYVVLCPILILYSLGYMYQPEGNRVSQTGLVHIATIPSGANIYLENRRFKQKTPATITGLIPEEYRLKINRKGYREMDPSCCY